MYDYIEIHYNKIHYNKKKKERKKETWRQSYGEEKKNGFVTLPGKGGTQ